MTARATITPRGADRVRAGHPWIYRSDVAAADAEAGDLVQVVTARGRPVGWAWFSTASQITLRMLTASSAAVDESALLVERLEAAVAYRASLDIDGSAWRVLNGEADRVPATIIDRYADESDVYFVVQTLAQGADRRLPAIVDLLVRLFAPTGILARNDPKVRLLEGLPQRVDVLYGTVPDRVSVVEAGVRFEADLRGGQKTGLFLDQRENHAAAARLAHGEALDAFSYNGGFGLHMAGSAEQVTTLDASASAVETTVRNAHANDLTNVEAREGNVFDELREYEVAGRRFDTVVLDPPAFAKNRRSVERAIAGYKEINLRALRLLRPDGHLITCSCSYNVDEPLFESIVRAAAADARAAVWLVDRRMQSRDHPVLVSVPETQYLKCLVLRRIG